MAGRKFNPASHPRDRFGRFTKSRTVKATPKDKATAKAVAEGFAPKQVGRADRETYLRKIAGRDAAGRSFADVAETNKALRAGKDTPAVGELEQAMVDLPDDVLLSRRVPLTVFGSTDPESLTGMKVRDAGFAPTQFGTVTAGEGQVRMRIAAPAGTRAAVNPDTGEVVLDRDTEMVVARVESNPAGGVDMYLTVLPKVGTTKGPAPKSEGARPAGKPGQQAAPDIASIDVAAVNDGIRAGETPVEAARLDRAMTPLDRPARMNVRVPLDYFGAGDITGAAGTSVDEPGFLLGNIHTGAERFWRAQPDSLLLNVDVPAGIPAVVDGRDIILGRNIRLQAVEVSRPDGGNGFEVRAKVVPGVAEQPEGGDQVRADLMKLKVPELQKQMRDRGLKPGRMRKSQLVDALVADETGTDNQPAAPASFADRVEAAATGQDALDAAPLGLARPEADERSGDRGGLSEASRAALVDYQGADYALINGALRDADTPDGRQATEQDGKIDGQIAGIDAATTGSPLIRDVVVWRGMRRATKIFGDRFGQNMTGMVWRESAYVSTSASRAISDQFSSPKDGVRMRVLVPAGVGTVEVSPYVDDRGILDEAELLLTRGLSMQVVADHGFADDGIRDLDVEVLP